jgi:hypothetical protein
MHVGEQPPEERVFLCVNRELLSHRGIVSKPGTMSASPLDLGSPEVQTLSED